MITILASGALTTVQDRGRPGWAHLGVPRAGALDAPAAAFANRLVGNGVDSALLEVVLGGLRFRAEHAGWIALTGAPAPLSIDGEARGLQRPEWVPAGAVVELGTPASGVRSYVAVAGGISVSQVLGSRSTDTLAWVGPPPVRAGDVLAIGEIGEPRPLDTPPVRRMSGLRVHPGPRADWFAPEALDLLRTRSWHVDSASDRIGLRLTGLPLPRLRDDELASEGMVLGAIQVPPSGHPIVLLADHPPTGGYPVLGVVDPADLWQCAQARPGEQVSFRAPRG